MSRRSSARSSTCDLNRSAAAALSLASISMSETTRSIRPRSRRRSVGLTSGLTEALIPARARRRRPLVASVTLGSTSMSEATSRMRWRTSSMSLSSTATFTLPVAASTSLVSLLADALSRRTRTRDLAMAWSRSRFARAREASSRSTFALKTTSTSSTAAWTARSSRRNSLAKPSRLGTTLTPSLPTMPRPAPLVMRPPTR